MQEVGRVPDAELLNHFDRVWLFLDTNLPLHLSFVRIEEVHPRAFRLFNAAKDDVLNHAADLDRLDLLQPDILPDPFGN